VTPVLEVIYRRFLYGKARTSVKYEAVSCEDGSSLLIGGFVVGEATGVDGGANESKPSGTRGVTEVSMWVLEAVAAGITFDVLKQSLAALIHKGRALRQPPADAAGVRQAVVDFLKDRGYVDITVNETAHAPGEGWRLAGIADDDLFEALAEPTGQLIHVRVDR
jgi:hypothetical protein